MTAQVAEPFRDGDPDRIRSTVTASYAGQPEGAKLDTLIDRQVLAVNYAVCCPCITKVGDMELITFVAFR